MAASLDDGASASDSRRWRNLKQQVSRAFPSVGDVPFVPFATFLLVLFGFACFTDVVLVSVTVRARMRDCPLPLAVEALNYLWLLLQLFIFVDIMVSYRRSYRQRARDVVSTPRIGDSDFFQPKCWTCASHVGLELDPRSYLLWLALLLPLNALLFYGEIAKPVFHYGQPWMDNQESRLLHHNVTELLENWPEGGGLKVDPMTGGITMLEGASFDPPLIVNSRSCYATDSGEFQVLGRLQGEDFPKQAYCETFIGTLMVDGASEFNKPWMTKEDRWDESFDFSLRLFSSLAGLIADQMLTPLGGKMGFRFLRDMTDVYDMYMLSFADVVQLHEGRPLLTRADFSVYAYKQSFHMQVAICLGLGVSVVLLRALTVSGVQPFIWVLRKLGCRAGDEELRSAIDSALSLLFVEAPFLVLRFLASWNYGVPVSVMAVKNSLGIVEDLYYLGFADCVLGKSARRRGCALLCGRGQQDESREVKGAAAPGTAAAASSSGKLSLPPGAASSTPVQGILLPEDASIQPDEPATLVV
jgi:hypothetical protein